jgi:hypothetical protein
VSSTEVGLGWNRKFELEFGASGNLGGIPGFDTATTIHTQSSLSQPVSVVPDVGDSGSWTQLPIFDDAATINPQSSLSQDTNGRQDLMDHQGLLLDQPYPAGVTDNSSMLDDFALNNAQEPWFQHPDSWDMAPTMQDVPDYLPTSVDFNAIADQHFTAPVLPAIVNQQAPGPSAKTGIPCTQLGCPLTFKRLYERSRHEATAHGINQGVHLCPMPGCPKSQGAGYSRVDKVKEHLWKKHANLGYTKSR